MKKVLWPISIIGLLLTIIPSFLVFNGTLTLESHKLYMTVGMVLWFATASILLKEEEESEEESPAQS